MLFVDEIHRLSPVVEEDLYPAIEDFQLDIMIGEGPGARSIKLPLQPFTLVGATTRAGLLTSPLRDRFGITQHLEFYAQRRAARRSCCARRGILDAADRRRGRARDRGALARHAAHREPAAAPRARLRAGQGRRHASTETVANAAMDLLEVDPHGFDTMDRRLLLTDHREVRRRPGRHRSLAAALGEERGTLEDVVEPYLIQEGFLQRTSRGRIATRAAYEHFGLSQPAARDRPDAPTLFD